MDEERSILIKKIIVHILDSSVSVPVLSDKEHPLDEEVEEFIQKHILKILKDDGVKKARFINDNCRMRGMCENIFYVPDEFVPTTREMANMLYNIMLKYPDIPSADLVCCLFDIDDVPYFGLFKFNYRNSYIHLIQNGPSGSVNSIIKQKTALPGDGQKADECAIIRLNNMDIMILEKKYEIDGEKEYYFSSKFLECSCDMSHKEKVKKFKKATESFNEKILGGDVEKSADIRTAINESIREKEAIDIVSVAENVFRRNPEMREAYIDYIEKAGLTDRTIKIDEGRSEKIFKTHKLKTDTGIEINLPVECYKDKGKVEFISNPDGTISILIKNVSKITEG